MTTKVYLKEQQNKVRDILDPLSLFLDPWLKTAGSQIRRLTSSSKDADRGRSLCLKFRKILKWCSTAFPYQETDFLVIFFLRTIVMLPRMPYLFLPSQSLSSLDFWDSFEKYLMSHKHILHSSSVYFQYLWGNLFRWFLLSSGISSHSPELWFPLTCVWKQNTFVGNEWTQVHSSSVWLQFLIRKEVTSCEREDETSVQKW
jgi:hypothetical protein